jgi:hypothetical protein
MDFRDILNKLPKEESKNANTHSGSLQQLVESSGNAYKKVVFEGYTDNEIRDLCHSKDHDCATTVVHSVYGKGKPVYESHAIPDDSGNVAWYDVQFKHGIEKKVPASDMEILVTESHGAKKKKAKKEDVKSKDTAVKEGGGRDMECGHCDGTGKHGAKDCKKCDGTGEAQADNDPMNNESKFRSKFEDMVAEAGGKKPDADGDGVPDWADKKKGKDDNAGKGKGKKPKKGVVPPQFQKNESVIKEGAEEAAELVMASKDMVDKITGWMEDTAEMQTESMLELADSIRDEMGSEKSEAFTALVKPSLEALYTSLEGTREALTGGVTLLTGEGDMPTPMGTDDEMGDEVDPEAPVDADVDVDGELDVDGDVADDFGADEVAAGGEEEAGRAKRESVERSRKLGTILSKKKS